MRAAPRTHCAGTCATHTRCVGSHVAAIDTITLRGCATNPLADESADKENVHPLLDEEPPRGVDTSSVASPPHPPLRASQGWLQSLLIERHGSLSQPARFSCSRIYTAAASHSKTSASHLSPPQSPAPPRTCRRRRPSSSRSPRARSSGVYTRYVSFHWDDGRISDS